MRTPFDSEIVYPLCTDEQDYIHARLVADGVDQVRGLRCDYPLVSVFVNRWDGTGECTLTYSLDDMPNG
jgi:hypothetical protein